jgi:hypothetical protein
VSLQKSRSTFGKQSHNLASIIHGYKSAVTTLARKQNLPFSWQSGYYDTILATEISLQKTRNYIEENPYLWQNDRYFVG